MHYSDADPQVDELGINNQGIVHCYNAGYRVNNDGQVESPRGCIRKLQKHEGYLRFTFSYGQRKNRKYYSIMVHRLAAYQRFGAAAFDEGIEVRHLAGQTNNADGDVTLGTRSENEMDKDTDTRRRVAGQAHRKFTDEQIAEMIRDRKAGMRYVDIMAKHGITSKGTLSHILTKSEASAQARQGKNLGKGLLKKRKKERPCHSSNTRK